MATSKGKKGKKGKKSKQRSSGPPAFEWRREVNHADAPVYLLHGDEPLFTREAASWVSQTALGDGIPDFNLDRFDASDSSFSVERLCNALETMPMMSARRVVHVSSAETLNKLTKDRLKGLLNYLERPIPESCLILEARARLDMGRALAKTLTKLAGSGAIIARESIPMDARQTERWLGEATKARGLRAPHEVVTLIQESAESRLGEMLDTLDKVALYIAPRVEVSVQDVTDLIPEAKLQTTVWTLLDKLALRQTAEVIALSHSLLSQGQEPLGLFALIHRRVRELTAAQSVLAQGGGESQLAQALGINQFATRRVLQLARDRRSFTLNQLATAYQLIAQADRTLKGSKLPQKLALEQLMISLCTC